MQMRDHKETKKRDSYWVKDWRALKVDPTYNVRDMEDPETIAHVRWLADSIKESGLRMPLEIRMVDDDIYVVAGHCRLAAIALAVSEGHPQGDVLCIPEKGEINDEERTLNLVLSNSGKNLTPLAVAEVVRRLLSFGWDTAKIAARLGWKSTATVEQYVTLLGSDSEVKSMVRSGAVAASTAAKVVKKEGTKAAAVMKAAAKTGEKITAKTIRESKGEFNPSPANVKALADFVRTIAAGNSGAKAAAAKLLERLGLAA